MINSNSPVSASDDAMEIVSEMIRSVSERAQNQLITADTRLLEELALDSLDLVRVFLLLEDRLGLSIDPDEVAVIKSAGDLAELLDREQRSAA